MKAQDLRIGNLIDRNGEIIEVKSIDDEGINGYNDEGIGGMNYSEYGGRIEDLKPVLITEERLLKAGFSNDKDICFDICVDKPYVKWHQGFYIIRVMKHDNGWWVILDENKGSERGGINLGTFHCIHQIQNIVFDLTGKELEIK